MVRRFDVWLLAILVVFGTSFSAEAVLKAVSPDNFITATAQDTGYPVWYQDFNDLKLELCTLENGLCLVEPPFDPGLGVGPETFWWTSEAAMAFAGGDGLLVLAMEGAFANEVPVPGEQTGFGRIRVRVNVSTPGTYTITHPFGQLVQVVGAADIGPAFEINETDDIPVATPGDFTSALGSSIGPFLFWDSELPVVDATGNVGDNFYIGDPAIEHRVLGSPLGTNFFRIERDGVLVAETALFAVTGKVFTGDGNTPPVAQPDSAAVPAGSPAMIDVLANDTFTDIPINPGSIAISSAPAGGVAALAIENGRAMVRYTPNAGFTGTDSFSYTIRNFAGLAGGDESAPAVVTLEVEAVQVDKAQLRTKLLKWQIEGSSSDATANSILLLAEPLDVTTTLSGAQEVPPVTTSGSGSASVALSDDLASLSFTLTTAGLLNTTAAHIHVGAPGVAGPVIFDLGLAPLGSSATGTLTAADLQPRPAQGINTYEDALRAILSGNAYVNVHTDGNPGGEIRGQLGPARLIGEAPVQPDGSWSFSGKSNAVPPAEGTIRAISSNRVSAPAIPLDRR